MDLALFPLDIVLFPGMELPLHIFEERYRLMVNECLAGNRDFGVLLSKLAIRDDTLATGHTVGTSARITQVERLEDGRMDILTSGLERFRVLYLRRIRPYMVARIERLPLEEAGSSQVDGLTRQTVTLFTQYLRLAGEALGDVIQIENMPPDATGLAYTIATGLHVSLEEKQQLLAIRTLPTLLWTESLILSREVNLLKRMHQIQESNAGYVQGPTGYLSLS